MEVHSMRPARAATIASLALAMLTACTSRGGSEAVVEREPIEPSTVSPSRGGLTAWRWIHRSGEGGWSADIGPKAIRAGSVACTFEHDDQAHTAGKVCCEGAARRWCAEMREDFVPGISLASDGRLLFVADYPAISSGARFAAYQLETGKTVWDRDALAIGPQAHSEYFNVVQLRLLDGRLIAYGDEAHGAYIESMDPASGQLIEHTTLERPQLQWGELDALPEVEPIIELELAGGGACRFEVDERGPARLQCQPVGAPAWARELEADFVGRGALASDGQRLVLVTWSRIASGARARAWALADGAPQWDRQLEGIGPQDHSKYSNLIQLQLDQGLLIVRGQESHGRYAEALDLATGALRWTISWPAF